MHKYLHARSFLVLSCVSVCSVLERGLASVIDVVSKVLLVDLRLKVILYWLKIQLDRKEMEEELN